MSRKVPKNGINKGWFKKGQVPWSKGKTLSKETREKISKANTGNTAWNKGKTGIGLREKNYNWKGGKTIQGGYVCVHSPNHPFKKANNYVQEHRLVIEKHFERYLTPEEKVHHMDGNKQNNKINNLMLFPNIKTHREYHGLTNFLLYLTICWLFS